MKLTDIEMLFLNSIQDGEPIFGINLTVPFVADQKYVEETINGLKEKGLIDQDEKLTKEILKPALALECYKKADTHLFINHIRIAYRNDKQVVAIVAGKDSYEFITCEKWELLYLFISNSEILNDRLTRTHSEEKVSFEVKELAELMQKDLYQDGCVLEKYKKGNLTDDYVMLWSDEQIDLYNGQTKKKKMVNGHEARLLLLGLFEMTEEVHQNG